MFSFATATRVVYGAGALGRLVPAAREVLRDGLPRVALVVTGGDAARARPVAALLEAEGVETVYFSVRGEPSTAVADAGAAAAREAGAGMVLAVGGGSVVDAGKAVAMLVANGGEALDYLEVVGRGQPIREPSLPLLAVPTTAGTGSEVTKNAVLTSLEHRRKASLRSPYMYPTVACVDPSLLRTVPPRVVASTGLDAFTQCLEPLVSCQASPLTDAVAREGLARGARALRRAYANPADEAAQADMAVCSLFGGLALANAKLGAVHGFAGVVGGHLPAVPHGGICAALLPAVIRANVRAMRERDPDNAALARYGEAAALVVGRPGATADDLAAWVEETCRLLGVEPLPAAAASFAGLVEGSRSSSSMKGNPIVLTDEELTRVLRESSREPAGA